MIAHQNIRTCGPYRRAERIRESAHSPKARRQANFVFAMRGSPDRARLNTLFAYSGISPHRFESFAPGNTTKNHPKAVSFSEIWLGQQDSNLHNWYQKPGSCHWTMAQCARLGFWDYNVFTGFASPANMHASLPGSAPESGNAHSTFFG